MLLSLPFVVPSRQNGAEQFLFTSKALEHMKHLLIIGAGDLAETVFDLANRELGIGVAAFAVHAAHWSRSLVCGLPVVDLEGIEESHPPSAYDLFVAIGYKDGNRTRQRLVRWAEGLGYNLPALVSPDATIQAGDLASNVCVAAGAIVQPYAQIGTATLIRAGAIISHHGRIGEACYIGPGSLMGGRVDIGERVFIGLGSRIRDGIKITDDVMVAMSASVTKDIVNSGKYAGSPARKTA